MKIRFRNFRILVLTFDLGYLNYSTTNCSSSSIYQYSVSCFWSADFKEPKICCIPVRKNITLYILKVIMSFKKYINILFPCIINKQEERLLLTSNPEELYTSTWSWLVFFYITTRLLMQLTQASPESLSQDSWASLPFLAASWASGKSYQPWSPSQWVGCESASRMETRRTYQLANLGSCSQSPWNRSPNPNHSCKYVCHN